MSLTSFQVGVEHTEKVQRTCSKRLVTQESETQWSTFSKRNIATMRRSLRHINCEKVSREERRKNGASHAAEQKKTLFRAIPAMTSFCHSF